MRTLLILTLTIWSLLGANLGAAATRLKVGLVLPLSGEWAFLGNGIRDGLLAEAARRCDGACSSERLANALRGIKDFPGSTGVVTVRDDGVIWTEAASVKVIRNGTAELITQEQL